MPEVLMPRLSDTMTEGILVRWLKAEGDTVTRGDVLAEVETDKATMEIEAYDSGVLTRIIAEPGSTVPIGQPIAIIGDPADSPAAGPTSPTPAVAEPSGSNQPTARSAHSIPTPPVGDRPARRAPAAGPVPMSPLARMLAREHGLDLTQITGTGPGGRIVRADVESMITTLADDDDRVPLSSIRRITAQRLTESAAVPHFYLTSIADAGALVTLRTELNDAVAAAVPADVAVRVSVTDLLIRACAITLRAHPQVNTSWAGDHLLRRGHVNIGCAVAIDDGLIVPVVRDADRKSLTEIAVEAHRLAERARAGKLTPDEFTGGTFTISNLGMYGVDHFTAVINPPEAAILAVGAAQHEAVVRDGDLAVATTMKLTLSIDHRVLDGATAAAFLRDLVNMLEHPLRILA